MGGWGGHGTISWWDNVRRTHQALAAHHLQQVQQSGAIPEVLEQVQDHARRPPLSTTGEYRTNKIELFIFFCYVKLLRCFMTGCENLELRFPTMSRDFMDVSQYWDNQWIHNWN